MAITTLDRNSKVDLDMQTTGMVIRTVRRFALAVAFATLAMLGAGAASASAATVWNLELHHAETNFAPGGSAEYWVTTANVGSTDSSGPVTVTLNLPAGVTFKEMRPFAGFEYVHWTCPTSSPGDSVVTCTTDDSIRRHTASRTLTVEVDIDPGASGDVTATGALSGGGAIDPATDSEVARVDVTPAPFGIVPGSFVGDFLEADGLTRERQAGSTPDLASFAFDFNTIPSPPGPAGLELPPFVKIAAGGNARHVQVDLPPGFVGYPSAVTECAGSQLSRLICPPSSQVGRAEVRTYNAPAASWGFATFTVGVYNMKHPKGVLADLGFAPAGFPVHIRAKLDPQRNYAISTSANDINETIPAFDSKVTLWGVPADASHDSERCQAFNESSGVGSYGDTSSECPAGLPRKRFLSVPANCEPGLQMKLTRYDSWENPGVFGPDIFYDMPGQITGCDQLQFATAMSTQPTSSEADSPSGLGVHLEVPQNDDPDGLATPPLKDATVTLPDGFVLSPSAADGLVGCTDAQMDFGTNVPSQCPAASQVGKVSVATPALPVSESDYQPEGPAGPHYQLGGTVYLRQPDPRATRANGLYAMFLAIEDPSTGVVVKVRGDVVPDPVTGQLTTTFANNPRLPFSDLLFDFNDGVHAPLATPKACGTYNTHSSFASWTGQSDVTDALMTIDQGCDRAGRFEPSLEAGLSSPEAGKSSTLTTTVSRPSGQQDISTLDVSMPEGLGAKLKGVEHCAEAQAAAGTCGAGSKIGRVVAAAGTGGAPLYVPQPGKAPTAIYLAGPYKGAQHSLSIVVPAQAGPFDLGTVVVRAAVHVDPSDAHVTVKSDPLPTILEGVPLRTQKIHAIVDRPGFITTPTDCDPTQVTGQVTSDQGKTASVASRFQVGDCANLGFKPKLTLALTGRKQVKTGKHPGIKATVKQPGLGAANIDNAVVKLPKAIALDPDNAQALCEFEDGTKPDLDRRCPKGSIVGRVKATTPLLDKPLVGNVYFVKNVRTDPKTGNKIRTLPMVVAALRGEISINVKGESSTTKNGQLVNTFAKVPDAPVSRFDIKIAGGKNGILTVTRTAKSKINLCTTRRTAQAVFNGQNGKRHDYTVNVKTPCAAKKSRKAGRGKKK